MTLAVKAVLKAVSMSPAAAPILLSLRAVLDRMGERITLSQTAQSLRRCGLCDFVVAGLLRSLLNAMVSTRTIVIVRLPLHCGATESLSTVQLTSSLYSFETTYHVFSCTVCRDQLT